MTTKQVLEEVRKAISLHTGSEKELYEELMAEAEGWDMRLKEMDDEEGDEG